MTPSTNQDSANDNRIGIGGTDNRVEGGSSRCGSFKITLEQGHSKSIIASTMSISPPQVGLTLDRRPSVGCNVIPHAALCQHRHSLQMNGEGGVFRVGFTISCFILSFFFFCINCESILNFKATTVEI